jgi:hypothetical protein
VPVESGSTSQRKLPVGNSFFGLQGENDIRIAATTPLGAMAHSKISWRMLKDPAKIEAKLFPSGLKF